MGTPEGQARKIITNYIYDVIIMRKDPDTRITGETKIAYAAFLAYRDDRDLKSAYNTFMQDNPEALTTMNGFLKWSTAYRWQKRVNAYDAEQDLFTKQEIRRKGLDNSLTSEQIATELYTTCMEEMELKRSDMTHRDIGKYLDICQKINDKWVKQPDMVPTVNVNVEQNVENTVKTEAIDPEIAAAVGKLIALKESVVVEE